MKIKLLDCTLRDGGYINNWVFGAEGKKEIEDSLLNSGIEYVESGFLTDKHPENSNNTFYNSTLELNSKILMVNFEEYQFKNKNNNHIRLAFKKEQLNNIKELLKYFNQNNINFSLNPMHISLYTEIELENLCNIANDYNPTCVTAVDTMGIMREEETKSLFNKLNKLLKEEIALGLHVHDNLSLAFKNTVCILNSDINREFIIDCTLDGIGRGGGMLSTNKIAKHLNDTCKKNYNLEILEYLADKYIKKINGYDKYPFYISATHKCHPNYALYLSQNGANYIQTEEILKQIPDNYKTNYNPQLIKDLHKKNFLIVQGS